MEYLALFILFVAIELVYFKIADKYNIIDKPNSRSSHTSITLRGGGILFPVAVLAAFFLGYISVLFTVAIVLVAVVSFIDDIYPLPTLPRFSAQLIAICILFYELHLFSQPLWVLPIVFVLLIGWINAFNFMDGINGITVLYAIVSIITFAYLHQGQNEFQLLVIVGISGVAFGFFNVRTKAKTFAGDVGSISMALFLGYFMIKTIIEKQQIGYLTFFSIYGIDAVVTILYRLKNKENILEPHRSHLYQYLANEINWSHIKVATVYALLQLGINCVAIMLINKGCMSFLVFVIIGSLLTGIYWVIRLKVLKIIKFKTPTVKPV